MACNRCGAPAVEWIRYSGDHLCREHFLDFVERRAKRELRSQVDLRSGERVAIGMSGGKDSSTTAALLARFFENRRDVELIGITIDEGIASYRPLGIEYARRLCAKLGIEHRVLAYEQTVGHTMDEVVSVDGEAIPCSYCGPFRRHALNRAAREVDADYVATGLNLDDTAQSILMNVARGDIEKLARLGPHETRQPGLVPRIQPLRMIPEKEVYLYAVLRGIEFHDATCPYAERAQRGRFREILHRLEEESPGTRHAIVSGYDQMRPLLQARYPPAPLNACARCGEPTVNEVCKACELRDRIARLETARALESTI
ncbi:MAG: TIGR00269 family protein [Methanobacteriota archaeon]|nr:MAG: TIGR00269 family protein [Euryarchaeota archaeon]